MPGDGTEQISPAVARPVAVEPLRPDPAPLISVIIPHYDDLERLDLCLDALSRQTFDRSQMEIIVADNRSPAGLSAVEHVVNGRARVVDAPIPGAGPARNAAMAQARGSIFAFTDCDCIPEAEWLAKGVAALSSADMIGGRMTILVGDEKHMSGAEAFEAVFAFNNRRYVAEEKFAIAANLFCRRDLFEAVGPFHDRVSEDKEWCLRAGGMGYRIGYADDAVVGHPARADWPQLRRKWQRLMNESYALTLDRGGHRLYWLARTWALLPSILVHGVRVLRTPALRGARHRAVALTTLVRIRLWRFVKGHQLLFTRKR